MTGPLHRPHRQVDILVDHVAILIEDWVLETLMLVSVPHLLHRLLVVSFRVVAVGLCLKIEGLLRVWELFLAIGWLRFLGVGDEDADRLRRLEVDQN